MLHIASYGWDHAAWVGPFYPEDMPPEWRLACFGNEFRALVVPAGVWVTPHGPSLDLLAEEVGGGLRIFLELPSPLASEEVRSLAREACARLGEHFGGLIPPVASLADGGPQLTPWSEQGLAVSVSERSSATPLELRQRVAALLEVPARDALLVFAGNPPSLDSMRAARVIAELLGV